MLVEDGRAVGVEYQRDGRLERARARREIILSAGALASPKLLMLSGIGPAEVLGEHGIAVRQELPGVGRNLQEHIYATMIYAVNIPSLNRELTPKGFVVNGLDFVVRGRGAASSPPSTPSSSGGSTSTVPRPDYEIVFGPYGMSGGTPAADAGDDIEYRHDVHELKLMTENTVMALPSISHPHARGLVTLHSAEPGRQATGRASSDRRQRGHRRADGGLSPDAGHLRVRRLPAVRRG